MKITSIAFITLPDEERFGFYIVADKTETSHDQQRTFIDDIRIEPKEQKKIIRAIEESLKHHEF